MSFEAIRGHRGRFCVVCGVDGERFATSTNPRCIGVDKHKLRSKIIRLVIDLCSDHAEQRLVIDRDRDACRKQVTVFDHISLSVLSRFDRIAIIGGERDAASRLQKDERRGQWIRSYHLSPR